MNYDGPEPSVECAYPTCANRLKRSWAGGDQWCSEEHRDGRPLPNEARGRALAWLEEESLAYAQGSKYAEASANRAMIAGYVETNNEDLWGFPLNYLKRAQMFGLDTEQGRQALGKAASTLIDYMTHAIEIHGPMPQPGFPSGEIRKAKP